MARDELIKRRVVARAAASSWCRHTAAVQALQRARELVSAAPGRIWPRGRLREAWVVYRYGTAVRDDWLTPDSGPERAGDHGADDAGTRGRGQQHRATTAIALYEQHADHRPPGWPRAGAAALCALASLGHADTLEGDIARLLVLAKDMRACTIVNDAERRARMTCRALARAAGAGAAVVPLVTPCAMGNHRTASPPAARRAIARWRRPVHMDHRRGD